MDSVNLYPQIVINGFPFENKHFDNIDKYYKMWEIISNKPF